MRTFAVLVCVLVLTTGCAALDSGAVRELSQHEKVAFEALNKRLRDNRPQMKDATTDLGELGAEWAEKEFEFERDLAKAKRLESMTAPWSSPRDEFQKTQRSVVLYHLYEVEMAEQKVLDARMAQRRAAAEELLIAYDRYVELLGGASKNLEMVLKYLDQPKSAQIIAFTSTFLSEATAFREQLQKSENPRLQSLAEELGRNEATVLAFKQQADDALQAYLQIKE
jgi:hypothetical protein